MTKVRYFSDTTSSSDQNMSESRPSTLASFRAIGWLLSNASRMANRGLVPMSPNTTPMAATANVVVAVPVEGPPCRPPSPIPDTF